MKNDLKAFLLSVGGLLAVAGSRGVGVVGGGELTPLS